MINNNATFWNNRFIKYGHTGWNNYYLYYLDQEARKSAILKLLDTDIKDGDKISALDFGCGTGDFTKLLSTKYEQAVGIDISNELINRNSIDNKNESIKYISNLNFIKTEVKQFNLILSITVLGHILDEKELSETLDTLYNLLDKNGKALFIENTVAENKNAPNDYQALKTTEQWQQSFTSAKFKINSTYSFDTPDIRFSETYKALFKNKLIIYFGKYKFIGTALAKLYLFKLKNKLDFISPVVYPKGLKVFILSKN
jgi:2-polyprenyl-3-methyl-5-hydroxy-6-metoxy-1,4-benzoquinol methylase